MNAAPRFRTAPPGFSFSMNTADLIMIGVACIAFACAGFVFCCCALMVLNPPPPAENRRAHRLAERLEWSGSVRLMK